MATKGSVVETTVRLESITIDGYRSCRGTTFTPNKDLSALIGINGAGKTNILQGIRLLDNSRGRSFRKTSEVDVQAGTANLTAWFTVNEAKIGLRVLLSPIDTGRRGEELMPIKELWNLHSLTGSKAWRQMPSSSFLRDILYGHLEQASLFDLDVELMNLKSSRYEKLDFDLLQNMAVLESIIAIDEFRKGISYYSASQFTDPSRCPSSFEVDEGGGLNEPYFGGHGSVHLKFLHDLYALRRDNPTVYQEYCSFVSKQQLGLVSRFTWKEIELSTSSAEVKSTGSVKKIKKRKKLVIPRVQIGTTHITFNQLSEGTFKTLALAFYVITDSSKLLMIEEPEVCVHHGLLRKIVETIKTYAKRKQTIVSTHSDQLLDELEPKHLFVVEMTSGGTSVAGLEGWLDRRQRDALHEYLMESGPLGEYWRSGGFS